MKTQIDKVSIIYIIYDEKIFGLCTWQRFLVTIETLNDLYIFLSLIIDILKLKLQLYIWLYIWLSIFFIYSK